MKHTKTIALILLITLFLSILLTACSAENKQTVDELNGSDTSNAHSDENLTAKIERATIKDSLPNGLNFKDETIRIYSSNSINENNYIEGMGEQSGDIVYDAVYARNLAVEERLGVSFKYSVFNDDDNAKTRAYVRNLILSNEDTHDLILERQFPLMPLILEGSFANVLEGEHFDFAQPWWWSDYMDKTAVGADKRYILVGDYFIDMLQGMNVLYFNKNMYNSNYGDPEDLYKFILDGKWTIDVVSKYIKESYVDVNGNNTVDEDDTFGYVTYATSASVDPFVYSTDIKFSSRDANGIIQINPYNDKYITLTQKLYDLFFNDGTRVYNSNASVDKFKAGGGLFLGKSRFNVLVSLRDMEDDYGILPYPKYDETQDHYRTLVHDNQCLGVIPITTTKLDTISAVVEALCAESYRSLIPAYYETALKVKYVRDDLSVQMIDMIHGAASTEFIYVYYESLNNIGSIYRTLMNKKSIEFVSEYEKILPGALSGLQKLITTYLENN